MRLAYLDAFSGISGDMTLGALLDLGLDLGDLEAEIGRLDLPGWSLRRESRERSGIVATKLVVEARDTGHGHRAYREIRELLEARPIAEGTRARALAIFERLAVAEAKVHGTEPDRVHFHEVGAIDSIVDVVGSAWAFDRLDVDAVRVSPLPLGSGRVKTRHGMMPVPAPATVELLRGFPVRVDGEGELVTPTGAAIVAALARPGPPPPGFTVEAIGYGAGDRELEDRPNLLRVVLGTVAGSVAADTLVLLEANVDDMNPEIYEYVMERLFTAGALDVFLAPVQMKKGRPATLVSALARPEAKDALAGVLFRETTSLGVRVIPVERLSVERQTIEVETRFGPVRVKVGRAPDGTPNVAPEHDDCRRIAVARGVALKLVYQEAVAAALGRLG